VVQTRKGKGEKSSTC